ncbi:MAG: hypothetical protein AAF804_05540 [Bacteroidota bacterium]
MKVSYWIEVLINPEESERVLQVPGAKPLSSNVIHFFEFSQEHSPHWCRIEDLLDQWEEYLPQFEEVGIDAPRAAVWMNYECGEPEISLDLDPMTLARLGGAGLRLCILGNHHRPAEPQVHWLPTQVNGCWSEPVEDVGLPSHRVEVWLDDHSVWEGYAATRPQLMGHWFKNRTKVRVSWQPGLLVVDEMDEESIENGIVALLRRGAFEQVFKPKAGEAPAEIRESGWELNILHDPRQPNPLQGLNARFKNWRQTSLDARQETLGEMLQELGKEYLRLKEEGFFKRDISLIWHQPYREQVRMEVNPEMMLSIGALGHHLQLASFPQAQSVARYWED